MEFTVIGRGRGKDPLRSAYAQLSEGVKTLPNGLEAAGSWAEINLDRCFFLVRGDDPRLFQRWVARWRGVAEFEIIPLIGGAETVEMIEQSR